MKTTVRRILLVDPGGLSLDTRIEEVCDVYLAAGQKLACAFIVGAEIVLVFQ